MTHSPAKIAADALKTRIVIVAHFDNRDPEFFLACPESCNHIRRAINAMFGSEHHFQGTTTVELQELS